MRSILNCNCGGIEDSKRARDSACVSIKGSRSFGKNQGLEILPDIQYF